MLLNQKVKCEDSSDDSSSSSSSEEEQLKKKKKKKEIKTTKLEQLRLKKDELVPGDEDLIISQNRFDLMMELLK